ncbi:MAG TPA: hypothetical protein VNN08_07075 [Thermoanaerobaculia bacterium]|nr:hypothetical protein [Thermoanaerobaculia bacterium]
MKRPLIRLSAPSPPAEKALGEKGARLEGAAENGRGRAFERIEISHTLNAQDVQAIL